ncbi:DUF4249 domain-containing protein [Spongiivirga sp. MCCC 1A20706]|uniref:DUF4249 domain-containing protein n=1 Tax=Spongiivirga sp. MCCC 1A20706 TaxID=3160963 RepID=UPI003977BA69
MKQRQKHIIAYFLLFIFLVSCLEEVPLETQNSEIENLVVVEATITDQNIQQTIKLSFSKKFEEETFLPLSNAQVTVLSSEGGSFSFFEQSPGIYVSTNTFSANPESTYQLNVETPGGRRIISEQEQIAGSANIEEILAVPTINDKGIEGIALRVATSSLFGVTRFFRYEYQETYKIIAPNWNPFEFDIINDQFPDFEVGIKPRIEEQQTCFGNNSSLSIILNETVSNDGNDAFEFRFLSREDPFLAHRYSVNLVQYTQSAKAANYWKTLQDFSDQENIFSQVQPGFLSGNLESISDDNLVVGFFEVASVTQKRVFINRDDFYNQEENRPYFLDCSAIGATPLFSLGAHQMGVTTSPLIDAIRAGLIVYYGVNENPTDVLGPYFVTARECGDCTALGSNVKPEFWTD